MPCRHRLICFSVESLNTIRGITIHRQKINTQTRVFISHQIRKNGRTHTSFIIVACQPFNVVAKSHTCSLTHLSRIILSRHHADRMIYCLSSKLFRQFRISEADTHSQTKHQRIAVFHPFSSISGIYRIISSHHIHPIFSFFRQYGNGSSQILKHSFINILLRIEWNVHCSVRRMRIRHRTETFKCLVPSGNLQNLSQSKDFGRTIFFGRYFQFLPRIKSIGIGLCIGRFYPIVQQIISSIVTTCVPTVTVVLAKKSTPIIGR